MSKKRIFEYANEPFMFLEGGSGLNEKEEEVYKRLVKNNIEAWSLENLYKKPERLASIQFLKPKTLIFGTTAVYQDKLDILIELANSLDLSSIERIILTLDTENDMYKTLKVFKDKYPEIEFCKFEYFSTHSDEDIFYKKIEL